MKSESIIFLILVVFVAVNDAGRRISFGGGSRGGRPPQISKPQTSNTHFINHESAAHRPSSTSNHGYPASHGLSGNQKPNSGGAGGHSYPANNGLSGNNHPGGSSTGGHSYPAGPGGHSYPAGPGLSGSNTGYHPSYYRPVNSQPNSGAYNGNYNYNYHPGAPSYGSPGYSPVYSAGVPHYGPGGGYNPTFVNYQTQSGSKINDLIVGLSVLNLARSFTSSGHQRVDHYYHNNNKATTNSDLTNCTLQLTKEGDGGIVKIPCEYVSSFTNSSTNATSPSSGANETLTDCTISITRNGRVEKTNVSCATLAQLAAKEASPPFGTLNCTQENNAFKNPLGFTPCRMADTLKDPDVPLEVLPLKIAEGNTTTTTTTSPSNTTTTDTPTTITPSLISSITDNSTVVV